MLLCTQTDYLASVFGDIKSIEMLAQAGFEALDYSMFGMNDEGSVLNSNAYDEHALKLKLKAHKCGVVFTQAHAPFPSTRSDDVFNKNQFTKLVRSMEIASILGSEYIVIHPAQHFVYVKNKVELKKINMEFYLRLEEYCKKFKICVAVENMFQYDKKRKCITESVCASPEEFADYIDTINSKWIKACVDVGHCGLTGHEAGDVLRYLGGERVKCLHIHDNDYRDDKHTLPGTMQIDFDDVSQALADIDYSGNFTYEADCFLRGYDDEMQMSALKFMADLGKFYINKINSLRIK